MDQIDQLLADAENTLHQASQGVAPPQEQQLAPQNVEALVERAVGQRVSQALNSLGLAQSHLVNEIGQVPDLARREVEGLLSRIKMPRDGKDVSPSQVQQLVDEAVSRIVADTTYRVVVRKRDKNGDILEVDVSVDE